MFATIIGDIRAREPIQRWFWNTAVLARLAWLLAAMVFAVYAGRVLAQWAWAP
jgi:hypothetical protein